VKTNNFFSSELTLWGKHSPGGRRPLATCLDC